MPPPRAAGRCSSRPAVAITAAGAAAAVSIKWAIAFEEKMAGVRKVLDMSREDIALLGDDIGNLSRKIPMAAEGLASIVEMAAQAGVVDKALPDDEERRQLLAFAEDAAKMAVAFDITAEQAASAMVRMRNQLGLTQPEVNAFGDAINHVGNNSGAGAEQILAVIERVGALGDLAGVRRDDLAALAASFVETSSSVEVAGTGFKTFLDALTAGEAATRTQTAIFDELGLDAVELAEKMQVDAKGAIFEVMEALASLDEARESAAARQLFGKESLESIGPLLNRLDILRENFALVSDDAAFTGSMLKEYETQIETTAKQWQLVQNNVHHLGRQLGEVFLPAIGKGIEAALKFLDGVDAAAEAAGRWTNDLLARFEGLSLHRAGVMMVRGPGAGIWSALAGMVDAIKARLASIVPDWTRDFLARFEGLSLYEAGVTIIESLGSGMWSVLTGMVEEIRAKLAGIVPDWLRRAWDWTSGGGPADAMTQIRGAIQMQRAGVDAPIVDSGGSVLGETFRRMTGRALGGPARAGAIYEWQEQGRELFVPAVDGRVIPHREVEQLEAVQAALQPAGAPLFTVMERRGSAPSSGLAQYAPAERERGRSGARSVTFNATFNVTAPPAMPLERLAREVERKMRHFARDNLDLALHDGDLHA